MIAEAKIHEQFEQARQASRSNESLAATEIMIEQFCIWIRSGSGKPRGYKSIMSNALNIEGEGTVKEAMISDEDAMRVNAAWIKLEGRRPDESCVLALYYVYEWDVRAISRKCNVSAATVSTLKRAALSFIDGIIDE